VATLPMRADEKKTAGRLSRSAAALASTSFAQRHGVLAALGDDVAGPAVAAAVSPAA
jgi:hypothetical protein